MSRAPFQVLVFLRRLDANGPEYLVLKRADLSVWQGVAGGGEGDESPREAAIRETMEEVGVSATRLIDLESVAMVPVLDVVGCYRWGDDVLEIPGYAFCVDVDANVVIRLSEEHAEYRWCSACEAFDLLEWDSNRKALCVAEARMTIEAPVGELPEIAAD